ncbi:MAG: DUF5518 domain-containing protein [Methanobacterium sp.]
MGYIICEKCGGYYELKEGEAINDFQSCECGGKLKYVKNLDALNSESDKLKKMSKCQFCGTENLEDDEFCGSCGKPLNYITEKPKKKISGINSPNQSEKTKKNEINIIAIISGLVTAIVIYFIYFLSIYIIPALFSGIAAGFFTSNKNYKKSILYGAITSLIGISICYVIINIIYNSYFSIQYTYIQFQPLSIVEILLLAVILGAIGGFIGSFLKQRIKYNNIGK